MPIGIHLVYRLVIAQAVSLIGSAVARFAVSVWVYQETGSVGAFSLLSVASSLPGLLMMPIAGSLADRVSRKKALIWSDCGAALGSVIVLATALSGSFNLWQLAVATAIAASAEALQYPSLAATISQITPKEHLTRVNGMFETVQATAMVLAPALAGAVYPFIGLSGLVAVEVVTCMISVGIVLSMALPATPAAAQAVATVGEAWRRLMADAAFGFRWVGQRRPLIALVTFFTTSNFLHAIYTTVSTPYVLSFSSETVLGSMRSAFGVGLIAGGVALTAWVGPRVKIYGVVVGWLALWVAVAGIGLTHSALLLAVFGFAEGFFGPVINGSSSAIWMSVCPNDVQGRVFAARRMIAWGATPLGFALATPIAKLFEPLADHRAAAHFGTGQTASLGIMITTISVLGIVVALIGLARPTLRGVEKNLASVTAA